jgi:hypothetical protein
MKFLERVFDPLEDKQVPLMALATSVAGEVGGQAIAADFDCGLEFLTPRSPRPWSSNRSSQTSSRESGMVAMAELIKRSEYPPS